MVLAVHETAPDFTVFSDQNQKISLHDFKGKKVVLYFYPKDDTPGCTKEACGFRDTLPNFEKSNAVILGISKDTVASHQKFKSKYDLPFTLLSDPEGKVYQDYGVSGRTTYLINEQGKIAQVWENVKVDQHIAEVLSATGK